MDGTIREGFLWNPTDAGYAMVAVAKLVLDGKAIEDGVEVPGLGKAIGRRRRQADQGRQDHARSTRKPSTA